MNESLNDAAYGILPAAIIHKKKQYSVETL